MFKLLFIAIDRYFNRFRRLQTTRKVNLLLWTRLKSGGIELVKREAIQAELESLGELLLEIYSKKLPLYEDTEVLFKTGGILE